LAGDFASTETLSVQDEKTKSHRGKNEHQSPSGDIEKMFRTLAAEPVRGRSWLLTCDTSSFAAAQMSLGVETCGLTRAQNGLVPGCYAEILHPNGKTWVDGGVFQPHFLMRGQRFLSGSLIPVQ
jgi:hypothetical protein